MHNSACYACHLPSRCFVLLIRTILRLISRTCLLNAIHVPRKPGSGAGIGLSGLSNVFLQALVFFGYRITPNASIATGQKARNCDWRLGLWFRFFFSSLSTYATPSFFSVCVRVCTHVCRQTYRTQNIVTGSLQFSSADNVARGISNTIIDTPEIFFRRAILISDVNRSLQSRERIDLTPSELTDSDSLYVHTTERKKNDSRNSWSGSWKDWLVGKLWLARGFHPLFSDYLFFGYYRSNRWIFHRELPLMSGKLFLEARV